MSLSSRREETMLVQAEPTQLVLRPCPLAVVIVGIDGWAEYTLPAIKSIREYEPNVPIVVVDNASDPPYRVSESAEGDPTAVVRTERICYAAAINVGLGVANADWSVVLNNDVLCEGEFAAAVNGLSPAGIYGMQLIELGDLRWLGGWIYAISRECREEVGDFDEGFELCGFEDLDYCIRALRLGFHVRKMDLPFNHLWGRTRWGLPSYERVRKTNQLRV